MRPITAGRIGIAFAVLLAIAVPAGLLVNSAATAYLDSQTARAALTAALAAVPVAAPETPLVVKGAPAGEQQRAQLLKPAEAYIRLLRQGDYDGAWELMDPDCTGSWTQESWTDHMLEARPDEAPAEAVLMLLLSSFDREVVEVATCGDEGMAHVALQVRWPVNLVLRCSEGDWAIDLAGSDRAAAGSDAAGQLEKARGDSAIGMLVGMQMLMEGGADPAALLTQGVLELEDEQTKLTSATLDGDAAQVSITCTGLLHLAVPLKMVAGRWQLDQGRKVRALAPGEDFRDLQQEAGEDPAEVCRENLRQLALGMRMYQADYDGLLPIADRWTDATEPYVPNQSVYHCPADDGEYSYAMNYKLSRLSAEKIPLADETLLLFETEPSRENAWDERGAFPGTSLADPPRHEDSNNFAWADGHVSALQLSEVEADFYRPLGRKAAASGPAIAWVKDHAEGLRQAKAQGKPVMIDLYADWCGPCNMLDEQTWAKAEVRTLAARFVCVKIDVDANEDIAKLYKVESIPLVVFLDPSGKEIKRNVGFVDAAEMLKLMEEAVGR